MSDIKIHGATTGLRPGGLKTKMRGVNRLHSISTNNVRSTRYGPVFMQRFHPDANFLATGHPVSLEHNMNI